MSAFDAGGDPAAPARVCLVLHGHLPYVHHPAYADFLEEDWFFEACVETYLPLLFILEDLAQDDVRVRLAVGLTPPLLEMLRAPALLAKLERHLDRRVELAASEVRRLRRDAENLPTALHYLGRFRQMREFFAAERGDLVGAFRRHQEAGRIELLASAATHAVLPLVRTEEARRFQIRLGVALYREVFGRAPRGFWMPECAYEPGVDRLLRQEGLEYAIFETHGVRNAGPKSPFGVHRPLTLPAGLKAFGRDQRSGRQVWSSVVGYPGDPVYRELYRDLGFDAPYDYVKPWLHDDGLRRNTGFKYHRVTGKVELHEKAPYDAAAAKAKARAHARHFVDSRIEDVGRLRARSGGVAPVVTAPYDLELFGHWWHEGPWFLEGLFRDAALRPRLPFLFSTPAEALDDEGPAPDAYAHLSTWGKNGFLEVWCAPENAWILRHQHELERRLLARAGVARAPSPRAARILDQMARELLLAQSSDWAFIIAMKTSAHYAEKRAKDHVDRFLRLERMLEGAADDPPEFLDEIEAEDALFPGLSFRGLAGGPLTRGRKLGSAPPPSRL
jgi:1,4-alpha-glucan branching enzyme